MKKKLIFLATSVVAGVSLIGTTFAAFAVSDNAPELPITISPNEIQHTTVTNSTMVLAWEDSSAIDISNLQLGVQNAQYATVGVKSTIHYGTDNADKAYSGGNLSLAMTGSANSGDFLLQNHLVIEVYDVRSDEAPYTYSRSAGLATKLSGLTLSGNTLSANEDIPTNVDGSVLHLYFKVFIPTTSDVTYGSIGVSEAQYNQMASQTATVKLNWDKPTGVVPATIQRLYFRAGSSYEYPHAYAYKQGGDQNGNWPGEDISANVYDAISNIYYYDVDMNLYDHIVFSSYHESTTLKQTADLDIPSMMAETPYFDQNGWRALPEQLTDGYYVVGTMTDWRPLNGYKMTQNGNVYSVTFTVPDGGMQYKVVNTGSNEWEWYGVGEDYSHAGNNNLEYNQGGDSVTISFDTTAGYPTAHTNN